MKSLELARKQAEEHSSVVTIESVMPMDIHGQHQVTITSDITDLPNVHKIKAGHLVIAYTDKGPVDCVLISVEKVNELILKPSSNKDLKSCMSYGSHIVLIHSNPSPTQNFNWKPTNDRHLKYK